MLWGGYTRFVETALSDGDLFLMDYFARGIALPAALFFIGMRRFARPRADGTKSLLLALALFWTGGLFLVIQQGQNSLPFISTIVIGICFGFGSGIMFSTLQAIVAAEKVYAAGFMVFAAAGVSAAIFFLVELIPREAVIAVVFAVMVPGMVFLAFAAQGSAQDSHPMFETVPRQRMDRCKEAVAELWKPLLCVAFSAIIVGIVRVGAVFDALMLAEINVSNMVGLLVTSIVLLASWRIIYERITLMKLYLVMFPLTATAFLLLPLFGGSFQAFFVSFVFWVFSMTSSFMVISCARTARNQCLPPALVYGFFAGIVYACSVLGSLVGLIVQASGGWGVAQLSVVALVAIYLLSMAMTVQRDKRKVTASIAPAREVSASTAAPVSDDAAQRCASITQRYALSKRESEVLTYLAKGRDVPFIAEELVISKNTVRSHTKNIFSKTGVHSRQELLDLIETVEG